MIASIILLCRIEKIKDINLFLMIVGMFANFVDFLTVPLISLGIPLSLWILYKSRDAEFERAWLKVIIASISWLVGYAGAWLMKWIQYDLTIEGGDMLKIGLMQSLYRTTRDNDYKKFYYTQEENQVGVMLTHIDTTFSYYKNILCSVLYCISKASIGTVLTGIIISYVGKMKKVDKPVNHIVFAFLLIMIMPIFWYVVLANHTILHDFFVYRHSILFMLGALLAFYYVFLDNSMVKKR